MSLLDVAPTLLELSEVRPPAGMHGVSMVPVLEGRADSVREYAYSRFGVHGGFGVRDARYSFQLFDPAGRGPASMVRSWFGQQNPSRQSETRHLRDRETEPNPGSLSQSLAQPEVEERLRASGEEWFEWIERARYHVQDAPWAERVIAQEEREELERRGLVAPPLGESFERAGAF